MSLAYANGKRHWLHGTVRQRQVVLHGYPVCYRRRRRLSTFTG